MATRACADLGHNDVGWHNGQALTPTLDRLVKAGVEMPSFYVRPPALRSDVWCPERPAAQRPDVFFVSAAAGLRCWQVYKMCAPSRASVLSGRYPWHVGYYDNNGTRVC